MKRPPDGPRRKNIRGIFFDIHCHAFNLSHAGLLAFLNRFFLNNSLTFEDLLKMRLFRIIIRFLGGHGAIFRLTRKRILILGTGLILAISLGAFLFWTCAALAASGVSLFQKILFATIMALLLAALLPVAILLRLKSRAVSERTSRLINLLSLMENDLGRQLLFLEMDILRLDQRTGRFVRRLERNPDSRSVCDRIRSDWEKAGRRFRIGDRVYRKVFLTPLLMDFNYKGFHGLQEVKEIHYNLAPRKPVIDQFIDLHFGIRDYWRRSPFRLLEIHPFMGLNTQHYMLGAAGKVRFKPNAWNRNKRLLGKCAYYLEKQKLLALIRKPNDQDIARLIGMAASQDDKKIIRNLANKLAAGLRPRNSLVVMLDKYFGSYQNRYGFIRDAFKASYLARLRPSGRLSSGIDVKADTRDIGRGFFAGIKVYPPLGFDPWPEPKEADAIPDAEQRREERKRLEAELRKVKFLYAYCQEKNIPITSHCSDSGFQVEDREKSWKFTNPERWKNALVYFPELKLNFAHFGSQALSRPKDWNEKIIDLMNRFPRVYADFSYRGVSADYYESLAQILRELPEDQAGIVKKRILFGTDFLINLIDSASYQDYVTTFMNSKGFTLEDRVLFSEVNPAKFLFG